MNYPFKKRRGRPPKYLNVWQHQHENHWNNDHNNNMYNTADVTEVPVDMSYGRDKSETKAEKNKKSGPDKQHGNIPVTVSSRDEKTGEDMHIPSDLLSSVKRNVETTNDKSDPDEAFSAATGYALTGKTDRPEPVSDGDPESANKNQQYVGETKTGGSQPREAFQTLQMPSNGLKLVASDSMTSSPVQARRPIKRRPGRPPGSTKRAPRHSALPLVKNKADEEDLSLRKFFEAGGRDYHQYLEWLKSKRQSSTAISQAPPILSNVTMSPAPFGSLPMCTGNNVIMPSQPIPNDIRFPAFPHNQTVSMNMSPIYRLSVPIMMPNAERTEANNPRNIPAAMVATGSQPDVQAPYDYKCFTFKRPNAFSLRMSTESRQEEKREDINQNACVLDLSLKRRRSDSDNEKENDCLHTSAARRAKTDKLRHLQDDVTNTHLAEHKPELETKHGSDALVESSTGCDVTTSWSVDDVANFVAKIPGCQIYAEAFRTQRIDGATLPHLSDDHLLNHVGMKLGHMIHFRLALSRLKGDK